MRPVLEASHLGPAPSPAPDRPDPSTPTDKPATRPDGSPATLDAPDKPADPKTPTTAPTDPGAPAPGVTAPELTAAAAKPVRVVFGQSAKEATWTPGAGTLLDLAEAQGLSPEFSCRGGTCGTCRVRVRQGEVTYLSRPTAATDKTTALICCGVPAAADDPEGRLVLDL